MDVFNKIKTQVSSVLLGNPISKDFEILQLTCLCGPGKFWKVFDAKNKSTKQEASVWIFEKKVLDKMSRNVREDMLGIARRGVVNLTKLRHPKILSVVHPIEESRESLAFATEPVYACLANVIKPDSSLPAQICAELKDQKLFDIEIKYGILQICEALSFLHGSCKQLHLNICPETVIVVKSGSWKLAGFEFSVASATGANTSARDASGELVVSVQEYQSSYHPLAQPVLSYCSPEAALQGRAVAASDMFALGMLIFSLFNDGKPLLDCSSDLGAFKKNTHELNNIRSSLLQCLPEPLREYLKLLIKYESTLRPDAMQLTKIPYFNDSAVTTLQSMDNLFQLDNLARSHFYKSLPKIVMTMPKRINLHRIMPQLTLEFNNNNMVPFVLPTVLQISDLCTDLEFSRYVLPKLLPVFNMSEPIQIILIILQNLNIMMSKCPESEFKSYILPMLNRALEVDNRQTQELCLKILPTVAHIMAFSTLKSIIFPRIRKLCINSSTVQAKVSCLICVAKLLEHTDKWFVLDDVLPMLGDLKTKEPAVLMAILGIYQMAFSHKKLGITKESLANKAVPFLLPLATDNNLNLSQYSAFMNLIQQMIVQIDTEHRSKLEQINGIQEEYKSLPMSSMNGDQQQQQSQQSQQQDEKYANLLDEVSEAFGFSGTGSSSGPGGSSALPQTLVRFTCQDGATVSSGIGSGSSGVGLSLQQKQRLASQQEQMTRLRQTTSGAPVQPISVNQRLRGPPSSQPKDLTSTLVDRNLAMMSQPVVQSSWNGTSSMSSTSYQPNYNISSPSNNLVSNGPQFSRPQQMSTQLQSQPRSNIDLSAFDNLCSLGPARNQIPMAAAVRQPAPVAAISRQTGPMVLSQPPAPSGTVDIDDLLG